MRNKIQVFHFIIIICLLFSHSAPKKLRLLDGQTLKSFEDLKKNVRKKTENSPRTVVITGSDYINRKSVIRDCYFFVLQNASPFKAIVRVWP